MGVSLAEALGQVDLEAGQVYRCEVNGHRVELRVLEPDRAIEVDDPGPMIEPWAELPLPAPVARVRPRLGRLPDPDIPEIPEDDEPL